MVTAGRRQAHAQSLFKDFIMSDMTHSNSHSGSRQPLNGWHVFTLRPAGEARGLLAALRREGALATNLPMLRLRGMSIAQAGPQLAQARSAHGWLFSSPAAVRHAARLDAASGLRLFAADGPLRARARAHTVYAPGPGTAQALVECEIEPVQMPAERFDSEGVLALPGLAAPLRGDFAIVGAEGGRGLIERTLTERGARIIQVLVYRREAARLTPKQVADLNAATKSLIVASSTALLQRLPDVLPEELYRRITASVPIVLASQRLSEFAAQLGFQCRWVAHSARPDALVEAALNAVVRSQIHNDARFG